jgi:hypothetical protein
MIELSNATAQTLTPGQSLTFDTVLLKSKCGAEAHRNNSSIITLRACNATYEVHFSANVSGTAAGVVQLNIELDGEPLAETTMNSTVTTAADPNNVATSTLIHTSCGCCGRITVTNTGTADIIVGANSSLFVKRVS